MFDLITMILTGFAVALIASLTLNLIFGIFVIVNLSREQQDKNVKPYQGDRAPIPTSSYIIDARPEDMDWHAQPAPPYMTRAVSSRPSNSMRSTRPVPNSPPSSQRPTRAVPSRPPAGHRATRPISNQSPAGYRPTRPIKKNTKSKK